MKRAPIINALDVTTTYEQYAYLSEAAFGAVVLDVAWARDSEPYRRVRTAGIAHYRATHPERRPRPLSPLRGLSLDFLVVDR